MKIKNIRTWKDKKIYIIYKYIINKQKQQNGRKIHKPILNETKQ